MFGLIRKMRILPLVVLFSVGAVFPALTHCVAKRDAHGLPCNENTDCWGDSMYCNTTPVEKAGKKVCLVDQSCTQSSDCTDPWMVCCVPKGASDGLRCRFDQECANTQCTKPNCSAGYVCVRGGKCLDSESKSCDSDCYQPAKCDVASGKCSGGTTGCTTNADCPSGQTCASGKCTGGATNCTSNADCAQGQTCKVGKCENTTANSCVSPQPGQSSPCVAGMVCCALSGQQGTCWSPSDCASRYTASCLSHKDCPPGLQCSETKCRILSSCENGGTCPTGFRCDGKNCVPNMP